ncbi:Exodeoxyribonuclease [Cucumispora dikerogammari]|nr:Exodeoxyribonuclease [Cucumispora dikerogammari]
MYMYNKQLIILSFNINGLKSFTKYHRKSIEPLHSSLNTYLLSKNIDIACFQETRGSKDTLGDFYNLKDYHGIFNHCKLNANRSGVCIFIKRDLFYSKVLRYEDRVVFKNKGRVLMVEMDGYVVFNVYFPYENNTPVQKKTLSEEGSPNDNKNKGQSENNSENKEIQDFYTEIGKIFRSTDKRAIICGDFNTTCRLSDNFLYMNAQISDKVTQITTKLIYNENYELKYIFPSKSSLEEHFFSKFQRFWLRDLLEKNFVDSFISANPVSQTKTKFTCWNQRLNLRKSNFGTRIDYILVSQSIKDDIISSDILNEEMGSDHCPVLLTLNVNSNFFSDKINLMKKAITVFSFIKK